MTPYSGGNLGDAAIQDAMIANLRERMPGVRFLGITLNGENFVARHGGSAFPLLAGGFRASPARDAGRDEGRDIASRSASPPSDSLRAALRRIPGLVPFLKKIRAGLSAVRLELAHARHAYRALRGQNLLILSGGGQLDEEWGGTWVHPYAICKWTLLARLARVPCAAASLGAGKIRSRASRTLLSLALRMCSLRSYRETKTRAIVRGLLPRAASDPVVPDLAFSLPDAALPAPAALIRGLAEGRPVVAVSPIAYGKPVNWPTPDPALYDRYVREMAALVSGLVERGSFVVLTWSSLGDDESVVADLLARLDEKARQSLRIHIPSIKTWRELVAVLESADYLVASRLHSTILGFVARTPVVAISFDPKVDWVMEDLGLTEYLLHIEDFTARDVLGALDHISRHKDVVVERLVSYRQGTLAASSRQYDALTRLTLGRPSAN